MNEQSGSAEHQAAQHTTTGVLSTSKYASTRHQCQAQPAQRQRTEEYFLSCRCQRIVSGWWTKVPSSPSSLEGPRQHHRPTVTSSLLLGERSSLHGLNSTYVIKIYKMVIIETVVRRKWEDKTGPKGQFCPLFGVYVCVLRQNVWSKTAEFLTGRRPENTEFSSAGAAGKHAFFVRRIEKLLTIIIL